MTKEKGMRMFEDMITLGGRRSSLGGQDEGARKKFTLGKREGVNGEKNRKVHLMDTIECSL